MAGMTTRDMTISISALSAFLVVMGFLLHISIALANLNQQVGMNTAAITANTTAISANATAIADMRKDMGDMREDLGEIRGLLTNHIAGHNHASVTTDSAESLE